MKRFLPLFLFSILLPLVAPSQSGDSEDDIENPVLGYRTALKFAPLSLLDIYSSVQFAVEQKAGNKSSLQLEGGYIFPINLSQWEENEQYEDMEGFRVRTEYRYYLVLSKDRMGGLYLGPELLFIKLKYDMEEIDKVYFFQGNGDYYYQKYEYEIDKRVFGFHAKIGYQKIFSDGFLLDFYAGLGSRNVNVTSGKPGDDGLHTGDDNDDWSFIRSEKESGRDQRLSASLGFKIGIRLR